MHSLLDTGTEDPFWCLLDKEYNVGYHFSSVHRIRMRKGFSSNLWFSVVVHVSCSLVNFNGIFLVFEKGFYAGTCAHNPTASRERLVVSLLNVNLCSVNISLHILAAFGSATDFSWINKSWHWLIFHRAPNLGRTRTSLPSFHLLCGKQLILKFPTCWLSRIWHTCLLFFFGLILKLTKILTLRLSLTK